MMFELPGSIVFSIEVAKVSLVHPAIASSYGLGGTWDRLHWEVRKPGGDVAHTTLKIGVRRVAVPVMVHCIVQRDLRQANAWHRASCEIDLEVDDWGPPIKWVFHCRYNDDDHLEAIGFLG